MFTKEMDQLEKSFEDKGQPTSWYDVAVCSIDLEVVNY